MTSRGRAIRRRAEDWTRSRVADRAQPNKTDRYTKEQLSRRIYNRPNVQRSILDAPGLWDALKRLSSAVLCTILACLDE